VGFGNDWDYILGYKTVLETLTSSNVTNLTGGASLIKYHEVIEDETCKVIQKIILWATSLYEGGTWLVGIGIKPICVA
ncbi:hypothetical protein ACH5RR_015918, partial [Cinchona calisaya]